ncbi:MAG: hypothetical protein U0984_14535 [Prosthecobacter sp.]|nr:hypothetical protein [Prosthecobacter sp.]
MKPTALSLLFIALPALISAQTATPAASPPGQSVKLTDVQVNNVLAKLKELEKQIAEMRGTNLSSILQKLREGIASDQAALKLYLDCDALVNSARKEESKTEARMREEQMKKSLERKGGNGGDKNEDGDFAMAVRFQIQYLIMTLEAHEAKEEEFDKMVPKLQAYIAEVIAAAPKIKGRALQQMNQTLGGGGGGGGRRGGGGGGGGGNPIIEAFQLDRYLAVPKWTNRPLDFAGMYSLTILPIAEEKDKNLLPGLWDARINAEGVFRKESMFAPEFELWTKNELPELRWERAKYLTEKGPDPVSAMAEMLKLIADNPGHANAPAWLQELRVMVNSAAPVPASEGLPKPAGT